MFRATKNFARVLSISLVALTLALGAAMSLAQWRSAQARPLGATYTVTNTNSSGAGSLRNAINNANANPGPDVISITANGTLLLSAALPVITDSVKIDGPGMTLFAIDGANAFRVLQIGSNAAVTIRDLTIQHGNAISDRGGGIFSQGDLTLTHVAVLSNTAGDQNGGGVTAFRNVVLHGGLFQNNVVSDSVGRGGGLYISGDTLIVSDTQFISNTALGDISDGGGIYASVDSLSITNAQFISNSAIGSISEGGGVSSFDLTEFDWWGEVGVPVGVATVTAGATGYLFPNNSGFTKAFNTTEIYGKIGLGVPLNPKVAVWYDVDKVKGAYFEGSVSHTVNLTPAVPLTFGALAGLSKGQGSKPDAAGNPTVTFFNFHDDGLTHGDFWVASAFAAGPISIAPSIHLVVPRDKLAHSKNAVETASTKLLFGATISWSKAFGGKDEAKE